MGAAGRSAGWGVWGQASLPLSQRGSAERVLVCFGPQTRHPSPFKNKNKHLCCVLCVLAFSFLLEAKNRCVPAGCPPPSLPLPTPPARRWAGPGLELGSPAKF